MIRPAAIGSALALSALLASPAIASTYTVHPGDTLSAIALGTHTTVPDLVAWNHLANANHLHTGQRLVVSLAGGPAGSYRVRPGDTLSGIAVQFGIPLVRLQAANPAVQPRPLRAGTLLVIPAAKPVVAATAQVGTYTVRSGDTLSGIAVRFHLSATDLARWNGLTNQGHIVVGQSLRLSAPASLPALPSRGGSVVVQVGDTLSGVAARTGTSVVALEALNGIGPGGLIRMGQTLVLPAGSRVPPPSPGLALLQAAERYQGVPYVWGGASPAGFDCSGLIQYAGAQVGLSLPRDSWDQFDVGTPVAEQDLRPGDLVFFQTYAPGASHVGIYAGNGMMFAAASELHKVTFVQFLSHFFQSHYLGARRLG